MRPATLADAPALAALGRDSFVAAFGDIYREEDLNAFLTQVYSVNAVSEEIAGEDCVHALAVDDGGALLAFCKLRNRGKLAAHSTARNPIELGQLYTAPGATGQGIGASLMEWAIAEAEARGHDAILLSVYSENPGAQRFYARYGFTKIADIHFPVGEQLDEEFLLEKRLTVTQSPEITA